MKIWLLIFGVLLNVNAYTDLTTEGFEAYESGAMEEAVSLHTQACAEKSLSACHNLGYMYSNADGIKKDKSKAKAFYQQACDAGLTKSCHNLGLIYFEGDDTKQDKGLAARLYRGACAKGVTESCYNLGVMYRRGDGVRYDRQIAIDLFSQACDGWNAGGCEAQRLLTQKSE